MMNQDQFHSAQSDKVCMKIIKIGYIDILITKTFIFNLGITFDSFYLLQWADKADPAIGWNGITKATPLKEFPPEEPNRTNPDEVIESIQKNDEVGQIIPILRCKTNDLS